MIVSFTGCLYISSFFSLKKLRCFFLIIHLFNLQPFARSLKMKIRTIFIYMPVILLLLLLLFTTEHSKAVILVLLVFCVVLSLLPAQFALLLLCLSDPVWLCDNYAGEEGASYFAFFL